MKTVTVLVAIVLVSGCVSRSTGHLPVDSVSLKDAQRLVGKSKETVVSTLGPPAREHAARLGTYWEYRGGEQVIVFWSFDHEYVLHVNIGKDTEEAYAPWAIQFVPPLQPTMTTETAPSNNTSDKK